MYKEKGSVYFVKHKGMNPIKIGYTSDESPQDRIANLATASPYGLQTIGIIQTTKPAEIEKLLHKKYSTKRLCGEWFNITVDDVDAEVKMYSDEDDLEMRHNLNAHYLEHISRIEKDRYYEKPKLSVYDTIKKTLAERGYSPIETSEYCDSEYIDCKDISNEIQAFGGIRIKRSEMDRAMINLEYRSVRRKNGISYLVYKLAKPCNTK